MSEQPQSSESLTGEDAKCQFPTGTSSVCGRPVARSGAPGRPGKYCDRDDHTRTRAFAARREIERGTTGAGRSGEAVADRPVSYGRASFEALLARFEELAAEHREQLGMIVAEAEQLVATVGDADAAAFEVAESHRAAEIRIAQAQTAQAAAEKAATAARRDAVAAIEAQAQADAAADEALAELARVRAQTAEQLTEYQAATEQAQAGQRAARAELEDAQADAQAQVKAMQAEVDAVKSDAQQLVKTMRGELTDATSALTRAQTEKTAAERDAELDRATVAQLRSQLDTERADHHCQLAEARKEAHDERAALTRAHADQLTAVLATISQPTGQPDTSAQGTRKARRRDQG